MEYINQLRSILQATGWSQEQLAHELHVSFPTVNAWLNDRATPRVAMQQRIAAQYSLILGSSVTSETELEATKKEANRLSFSATALVNDRTQLDKLTLYLTYHTNTIEGSTMTLSDVEDVIFDNKVLANRTATEQAEARNHQAALYWLLDAIVAGGKEFVVNEQLIFGIHLRLMNGIISNAGQYRTHAVRIMGAHVPLANWQGIPELIKELTDEFYHIPEEDAVASLARFHATFEKIHPFSDGNGRTGRLLLLAQALSVGLIPPLVIRERKQAYYKYLETAQVNENFDSLELFIAQSMVFCYELLTIET